MLKFKSPYFFLLLIPLIMLFFYKIKSKGIIVPSIESIKKRKLSKKYLIPKFLIFISLVLMVIALARPQEVLKNSKINRKGIDIVLALDLSQSMMATDFSPNRLEKAKELIKEFLNKRDGDRVSLVVFGGDAYSKVPLTFDLNVVKEIVTKITVDDITSNNRTAIGMGLGVALNRVKESSTNSSVVILLTDGENNSGEMSPEGAAKIAKDLGVKVYTIGIGAREIEVPSFFGTRKVENTELDEGLLNYIAETSSGKYFRASNVDEFRKIFNEIDKIEKKEIEAEDFYQSKELYENLLKIALIFLVLGLGLNYLMFIRIP
ncbi:MAG: vWA domain-containing protein [Fusobacteriaceae bacterium]